MAEYKTLCGTMRTFALRSSQRQKGQHHVLASRRCFSKALREPGADGYGGLHAKAASSRTVPADGRCVVRKAMEGHCIVLDTVLSFPQGDQSCLAPTTASTGMGPCRTAQGLQLPGACRLLLGGRDCCPRTGEAGEPPASLSGFWSEW